MRTYTIKEILDNPKIIIFIENKEQFDRLSNIKELKLTNHYMGSYCYSPHSGIYSSSSTKTYSGAFDSGSIIITFEQIIENIPEKEENKPKIEVGKWYSFNWDWFSPDSTIIAKIKEVNKDSFSISWRSYLWVENDYSIFDRYKFRDISNIKELSIDEVQKYLPDGHPDKFSNFNTPKYKTGDEEIVKAHPIASDEVFELPEKWCIKSNKDIDQILCKWRGGTHSLPPEENILTYQGCWVHVKYIEDFTEITFEQFKKYVLKEPEKMKKTSKGDLITRAVKTNNPQLIADELGYSIEEIIESENSTIHSCVTNNFKLLKGAISCSGLSCTDDKCPFYNSNEEVISWLRGENKSVSPPESELERWLRETKAKNLSLEELEYEINYKCSYSEVYKKLQGESAIDKAQILYKEWNVKQERDWTKATKEELLEEANRRYPIGTKYYCCPILNFYVGRIAEAIREAKYSNEDVIEVGFGYVYYKGKWAEVISETDSPNVEATSCAETDKTIDFNFLPDPD